MIKNFHFFVIIKFLILKIFITKSLLNENFNKIKFN